MESEIIYLATPYVNDNMMVMDFRADVSDAIAADLSNKGCIVFAPISAWHSIAKKHGLPKEWEFWGKFDEEFIKVSGQLMIITLFGWRGSVGVTAEIDLAERYDVPMSHIDPGPYVEVIKKEGLYPNILCDTFGASANH